MRKTEYYTSCGHYIQFAYREITLSTIDHLAQYYCRQTNRAPTIAIVPSEALRDMMSDSSARYTSNPGQSIIGYTRMAFWTHAGEMTIISNNSSVLEFFVGTEQEYEQTKIDKHFEEIVLQAD